MCDYDEWYEKHVYLDDDETPESIEIERRFNAFVDERLRQLFTTPIEDPADTTEEERAYRRDMHYFDRHLKHVWGLEKGEEDYVKYDGQGNKVYPWMSDYNKTPESSKKSTSTAASSRTDNKNDTLTTTSSKTGNNSGGNGEGSSSKTSSSSSPFFSWLGF